MRLDQKIAVVTGGGTGIGEAIASRLAEEGARVGIMDMDLEAARRAAESLKQRGLDVIPFQCDVTNKAQVRSALDQAMACFGRIDILVNNAGIIGSVPVDEMPEETWDRVIDVNLKGYFLCSQAVTPQMKQRRSGKIINIASRMALGGQANIAHYTASKAGVIGLTRALASELASFHINVNAVSPGVTRTTLRERTNDEWRALAATIPWGRVGEPKDIANAVLFFASDESEFVTGQCLYVCGGRSIAQAPI